VTLTLPAGVQQVAVDLAIELEQLSFAVTSRLSKIASSSGEPASDVSGIAVPPAD
jgi:hypothetical protein